MTKSVTSNTKRPEISILIPVYNTSSFLDKCLRTVLSQTFSDIEVIIVNDASTDNSAELCAAWERKDKRVKVVHKARNEGLLLARKTGVSLASGKYIVFLDSDDYFENLQSLEIAHKLIQETEADFLQFSIKLVDYLGDNELELNPWYYTRNIKVKSSKKILEAFFGKRSIFSWTLWNKIYKSSVVKEAYQYIRDIPLISAEDAYALFLISFHSQNFVCVKTSPILAYRQGSGSTTNIPKDGLPLHRFEMFCKEVQICDYLKEFLIAQNAPQVYHDINHMLRRKIYVNTVKMWGQLESNTRKLGDEYLVKYYSQQEADEALALLDKLNEPIKKTKYLKYKILSKILPGSLREKYKAKYFSVKKN